VNTVGATKFSARRTYVIKAQRPTRRKPAHARGGPGVWWPRSLQRVLRRPTSCMASAISSPG